MLFYLQHSNWGLMSTISASLNVTVTAHLQRSVDAAISQVYCNEHRMRERRLYA
jgi:hypothetical protein